MNNNVDLLLNRIRHTLTDVLNEAVIKRNLPIQKYTIVDSFATDDVCMCDNCNKAIKNIAVVKGADGQRYNVGTDCAATLSGINDFDIQRLNSHFEQVKKFYAKVRKYEKEYGPVKVIKNTYYSNDLNAYFDATDRIGNEINFPVEINPEDFVRYCPKYRDITYVNLDFKKLDEKTDSKNIEDGQKIAPNAYIKMELMQSEGEFKYTYAYAAIVDKNGDVIVEGSNGGRNFESCQIQAVRCLNKYLFEKGLKKMDFEIEK